MSLNNKLLYGRGGGAMGGVVLMKGELVGSAFRCSFFVIWTPFCVGLRKLSGEDIFLRDNGWSSVDG